MFRRALSLLAGLAILALLAGLIAPALERSYAQVNPTATPPTGLQPTPTSSGYRPPSPFSTPYSLWSNRPQATPNMWGTPYSLNRFGKTSEERQKPEGRTKKKETPAVNAVRGTPTRKRISKEKAAVKEGVTTGSKYEVPALRFPPDALQAALSFSPLDVLTRRNRPFEVAVTLSNRSRLPADGFRFTVEYDPRWLSFQEYDASALAPCLADPAEDFRFERREGRLIFSAEFAHPLADEQAELLKLRFSPQAAFGTTALRFAVPPDGVAAVYSHGRNLLAATEQNLKGVVSANVFIRAPETDEAMQAALAEAGLETTADEPRLKGWAEAPADARPDAPVSLALQPPEQTSVTLGRSFWVDLVLYNDDLAPIDSIGVRVEFDPRILQVIDEDENNWISQGANVWDGAFHASYPFDVLRSNSVDNQQGVIRYAMGRSNGPWPFPTGIFARVHFRAIAPATSTPVRLGRRVEDPQGPGTHVSVYGFDRLSRGRRGEGASQFALRVVAEAAPHNTRTGGR